MDFLKNDNLIESVKNEKRTFGSQFCIILYTNHFVFFFKRIIIIIRFFRIYIFILHNIKYKIKTFVIYNMNLYLYTKPTYLGGFAANLSQKVVYVVYIHPRIQQLLYSLRRVALHDDLLFERRDSQR